MKYKSLLACLFVLLISYRAVHAQTPAKDYLIPAPYSIIAERGEMGLSRRITYSYPSVIQDSLQPVIEQMHSFFKRYFTENITKADKGKIRFIITDTISHAEGYLLQINKKGIQIGARDISGLFYGWQTLQQILLYAEMNRLKSIPCTRIYDYPRFQFRALMLDPARHFLSLSDLKAFIRTMAFYKYNYLHLHLTDDQGWRVEIKAYPQLTQKGSLVKQPDGSMKPMFYTQKQLRDLVQYAQKYHVQIIPEIDIPGHNTAFLSVFPNLTCFPKPTISLRTTPGVSKDILCPADSMVYQIYKEIFTELAGIFPCKYFHLGGDEAPLDTWKESAACQRMIKEKGLKNIQGLMAYFLQRNAEVLIHLGKTPLFWYELDVPYYPRNSIAYFWRMGLSQQVIHKASSEGHLLIGAPGEFAYFDYPQSKNDTPPASWMPVTTLHQVYKFNPGYQLPDSISKNILGIEATIWGEYVPTLKRAYYQTYPRALAFAEAGWSQMKNRNWTDFKKRLLINLSFLLQKGVNYRPPYEDFLPSDK